LRVWKISELVAWYRAQQGASSPPADGESIALREDGTPFSAVMQGAAKRYAAPELVGPSDEVFDTLKKSILERAGKREASKNGKHDKKG
jgi:hypothetical protein